MTDDSANPYCSPALNATAGSVRSAESRQRFRLVVAIYLIFPVANVIAVFWPEKAPLLPALCHVAMASMTTYWCALDSRLRRAPIMSSLHAIMFFTWPIAVPMYLIGSRKLRGLGLVLAHAIGLFATAVVTYLVAGLLAHGGAWFVIIAR